MGASATRPALIHATCVADNARGTVDCRHTYVLEQSAARIEVLLRLLSDVWRISLIAEFSVKFKHLIAFFEKNMSSSEQLRFKINVIPNSVFRPETTFGQQYYEIWLSVYTGIAKIISVPFFGPPRTYILTVFVPYVWNRYLTILYIFWIAPIVTYIYYASIEWCLKNFAYRRI